MESLIKVSLYCTTVGYNFVKHILRYSIPVEHIIAFSSHPVGLLIDGDVCVASLAQFIGHVASRRPGTNNHNPSTTSTNRMLNILNRSLKLVIHLLSSYLIYYRVSRKFVSDFLSSLYNKQDQYISIAQYPLKATSLLALILFNIDISQMAHFNNSDFFSHLV